MAMAPLAVRDTPIESTLRPAWTAGSLKGSRIQRRQIKTVAPGCFVCEDIQRIIKKQVK
jgi:hypothetical protein